MSSRFEWRAVRAVIVGLSVAILVNGIVAIVRFPIA